MADVTGVIDTTLDTSHRTRRPRVVVVGSYGVGLTVTTDRAPEPGETLKGHTFAAGHGGKGSNQAVAAARLGADVQLFSAVGDDQFGRDARELWASEGVDAEQCVTIPGSTMVGVILVEATGENRIAIVSGVLDAFGPAHLEGLPSALATADVLLTGLEIPVETAAAALLAARRAGVTTVLNPAPAPPGPLPPDLLELVDHLIPNRTEAATLAGLATTTDPAILIDAACFERVPHVVLTLGEQGAMIRSRQGTQLIAASQVDAIDTTGAGDTFNAAYAVALANGAGPPDAAAIACRAAAISVTRSQVIPSLPYAHELEAVSGSAR